MALNTHLGFLFKATDQASGVMRRISLGLQQLRSGSALAAKAMAGVSLSFAGNSLIGFAQAGAGALLSAAEASGKFTQELTAARGVMEGATVADMDRIGEAAKRLGMKYGIGAQMIAAGATEMGRAGRTPDQILQLLEPTLRFASSAQMSFDDASRVLMSTMTAFKIPFEQASVTVDKFANILNTTQASGKDIQTTFAKAASIAGAFDQNIDEALVMMGVLKQLGFDASSTSTNMRQAISRIYSMPSVINKINELKVALYDPVTGARRPWHEVAFDLADVHAQMDKSKAAISQYQIYGARGIGQDIAALRNTVTILKDGQQVVVSGRDAFVAMLEQQKKTGTAQRLSDMLINTFEGQRGRLKATLQNLKIDIGKGFEEALLPVIRVLNRVLSGFEKFLANLGPQGRQVLATFAMIEIGVIGLTGAIMALLGGLVLLKLALPVIAPMLAPVLAITVGVLAVTAALVVTYKALQGEAGKTGTFMNQLGESFQRVKLFAQGLWQLLTTGKITGLPMLELLKKGNKGVLETLGTWWQKITRAKAAFQGFMDGLASHLRNPAVQAALDSLKQSFSSLMDNLGLGSQGLDKLTNTTGDARTMGREWGKWLWWVTFMVIGLADAIVRIADVMVSLRSATSPVFDALTSGFGRTLLSILAISVAARSLKSVFSGLFGTTGGKAGGAGFGSMLQNINNLRKQGGNQVLSSTGQILASQAPNIGRQLLNLSGITALGQIVTRSLGYFNATSGLATTLAGNVGKLNLGTAGFVAASAAAGYAFGTLLDQTFGLSDSISKWLYDAPEMLKTKEGGVYLNEVASRAAPAFLAPGQATASNSIAGIKVGQQAAATSINGIKLDQNTIAAIAKAANQPVSAAVNWDGQKIAEIIVRSQAANNAASFNAEDND